MCTRAQPRGRRCSPHRDKYLGQPRWLSVVSQRGELTQSRRADASRVDHRARARHAQRTIPLRMRRCGDRTTARAIFTTTAVATHAPRAPTLWQAPSGGRSLGPRRSSGTCGPSSQQAACERPTRTVVAAGVHVTMGALFRNLLNARRPCSLHAHIAYSLRFTSSRHHSVSCGAI